MPHALISLTKHTTNIFTSKTRIFPIKLSTFNYLCYKYSAYLSLPIHSHTIFCTFGPLDQFAFLSKQQQWRLSWHYLLWLLPWSLATLPLILTCFKTFVSPTSLPVHFFFFNPHLCFKQFSIIVLKVNTKNHGKRIEHPTFSFSFSPLLLEVDPVHPFSFPFSNCLWSFKLNDLWKDCLMFLYIIIAATCSCVNILAGYAYPLFN